MRRIRFAWLVIGILGWIAPAHAHLLNMTRVQVDVGVAGDVAVTFRIDLERAAGGRNAYFELTQHLAGGPATALWQQIAEAMQLTHDGVRIPLAPRDAKAPPQTPGEFFDPLTWPLTEVRFTGRLASTSGVLEATFDGTFPFEEPIALTFHSEADDRNQTRWLVAGQSSPRFSLEKEPATPIAQEPWGPELVRYLRFGFLHIVPGGLDHVLFVLGLFLGASTLRSLLVLISTFTLAHSITLILSTYGAIRMPGSIVEPAIALSIAWVGIENLMKRDLRSWRVALVFAFGLLHGAGFAAALSELGLPRQHFVAALLAFNVGVEAGQVAVIAGALLLVGAFRAAPWYRQRIVVPGSAIIAALALFWTVQRIATGT